ncbi:hypothetical protein, partial [Salmonella sp. s51228]|uniref:hypothetical protein n=1 Tax=Salmonella sp. s51228 TaxID=3159652 RepID=UPI00398134D4
PENWGTTEDIRNALNNTFQGSGREEDGYAAIYRSIRKLDFQALSCKKIVIFTDENRDTYKLPFISKLNEEDTIPYLQYNTMENLLQRHNIQLSGVISFEILVDGIQTGSA